jgi:hypothetical protein
MSKLDWKTNLRPGLNGALFIFFGKIKKREWRTDKGAQKINN